MRTIIPDINLSQRILHVLVVLWILFKTKGRFKWDKRIKSIFIIFSLFYAVLIINYALSISFSLSDLSDLLRPLIMILYVIYGYSIDFSEIDWLKIMKRFLLFQLIIVLCNYIPLLYFISDLWKGRLSTEAETFHFFRASGTLIWPGDFSYVMLFLYIFFSYSRAYLFSTLSIILIALSASRVGIGALILVFLYQILTRREIRILLIKTSPLILIFTYATIRYFNISGLEKYLSYVNNLIEVITTGNIEFVDSSIIHRFNELRLSISDSLNRFPLGVGPSREYIFSKIDTLESFYSYYLWKYGFLGLTFMLSFYFLFIHYLRKVNLFSLQIRILRKSMILQTVLFIILLGFTSALTERFKLFPLYFIIMGILINPISDKGKV